MPKILEKPACIYGTFKRKPAQQQTTHYCPGCGHGVMTKLIGEAISDLEIQDRVMLVGPVGCAVFIYYYYQASCIGCAHGRAPAVATGISRGFEDAITICYQGDGDLAAIGTNNTLHAANRGENLIVFYVNNTIYGMTGGQLSPTSLIGQKTTTSPYGRDEVNDGQPIRMSEIIATLDAPALVARAAINTPKNVMNARRLIRKGLQAQKDRKGYCFIELLTTCPTNWRLSPVDACKRIDEELVNHFPLGVFKDELDDREPIIRGLRQPSFDEIAAAVGLDDQAKPLNGKRQLPYPIVQFKSAGFGGQGILSLGHFLADACMKKDFEVTWMPSYGPEMRGGVANCSVVVSENPIGTPAVDEPNILIALNKPSLTKFGPQVPRDGIIIYNSSLISEVPSNLRARTIRAVDAMGLAQEAGNAKASNTVSLGAMARLTDMFTLAELSEVLRDHFPNEDLYQVNLRALQAGWDAMAE